MRALLYAELESKLGHLQPSEVIAVSIRPSESAGVGEMNLSSEGARVVYCPSNLSIRREMARHEAASESGSLVILTDRMESDLEQDLIARFSGRKLIRLDPWHAVAQLFKVQQIGIDGRLRKKAWIASKLIERAPKEGYAAVPGGVLTVERAYHELLRTGFGFDEGRPDFVAVMRWGRDRESRMKLAAAPTEQRADVVKWIADCAGATVEPLMSMLVTERGDDALAFGLALDVFRLEPVVGTSEQQAALIRCESLLGGRLLQPQEIMDWADASRRVLDEVLIEERPGVLKRAEAMLDEVRAGKLAAWSDLLPRGLTERERNYASAIDAFVADPSIECLRGIEMALQQLEAHHLYHGGAASGGSAHMALRLARWLRTLSGKPSSYLSELARAEHDTGGFVELARERLSSGRGSSPLIAAYKRLIGRVVERREQESIAFGQKLSEAVAIGKMPRGVIGIEEVLDSLVVPLADKERVLVLVLDGGACSQLSEIGRELEELGLAFCAPEGGENPVVLAALPSLTEVSRASLLAGRLVRGKQADEKKWFSQHEGLLSVSKRSSPPVLFHKKDLADDGSQHLAKTVRDALADKGQQVVGIVINAIDDHLMKGDQVAIQWSLDQILYLRAVLDAAQEGGRVVILTADHGHVLERDLERSKRVGENARWRLDVGGEIEAGEVLMRGPRVLNADGKAILMSSVTRRYAGMNQNGYHGGASPQEVVVPLAILAPRSNVPKGWQEIGFRPADFWLIESDQPIVPVQAERVVKPIKTTVPKDHLPFELVEKTEVVPVAADWVKRLVASELYLAQEKRWKRMAPQVDRVGAALEALSSRGGKMTAPALARVLNMPLPKLAGFGAALQKLLNLDGVFVVTFDANSNSWELDEGMAQRQFLD